MFNTQIHAPTLLFQHNYAFPRIFQCFRDVFLFATTYHIHLYFTPSSYFISGFGAGNIQTYLHTYRF